MFGSLARACSRAELSHAFDGARNDEALLRATTGARVAHEAPRGVCHVLLLLDHVDKRAAA